MRSWLLALLVGTLPFIPGCCPCDPATEARDLAGDPAVDCGATGDVVAQRDCANAAMAGHRAFVLRQRLMGIDSQVESWAIGDSSGHVFTGTYDSDPSGGGDACERFDVTSCTSLQIVESPADPSRNAMACEGAGAVRHMCD